MERQLGRILESSVAALLQERERQPKARDRDNAQNQMPPAEKPITTGATQQQPPTPVIPYPRRNVPAIPD